MIINRVCPKCGKQMYYDPDRINSIDAWACMCGMRIYPGYTSQVGFEPQIQNKREEHKEQYGEYVRIVCTKCGRRSRVHVGTGQDAPALCYECRTGRKPRKQYTKTGIGKSGRQPSAKSTAA